MKIGSGNEAAVDAALASGCMFFAGYPSTPATEILELAAAHFPANGAIVVPAESEIAALAMVAGASLVGYRAMTATTGLGMSLMAEGLSFFSGMTELPAVVVCQQRWGAGDGSLGPGQDSYRQATSGAGHGDFRLIVLLPSSAQETADHVRLAFELAERHRMCVVVLGDQLTAMTCEGYDVDAPAPPRRRTDAFSVGPLVPEVLAVDHKGGDFAAIAALARRWEHKYEAIVATEARHDGVRLGEDLDVLVVAYGSLARTAVAALPHLDAAVIRVGVFRPITGWPFPEDALVTAAARARQVVVAELSMGQLIDDVRLAIGRRPDGFVNWLGGEAPSPDELAERVLAGRT